MRGKRNAAEGNTGREALFHLVLWQVPVMLAG